MYCRKCGAELREDSNFCPKCGTDVRGETAPVVDNEKSKDEKSNKKNYGKRAAIITGCLLVVLVVLFVVLSNPDLRYKSLVSGADAAIKRGNYEAAINSLEDAVTQRPDEVDNYIKIATAYVENGDLYHAKEMLKEGYVQTRDEELQKITIWGPLPCYESVIVTDGIPIFLRCEYVFSEDTVVGNIYYAGKLKKEIQYYFEDERVAGTSIISYGLSMFRENIFSGLKICSEAEKLLYRYYDMNLDYEYNVEGLLSSITENGEVIAMVEYKEEAGEKHTVVDFGERTIDFFNVRKGKIWQSIIMDKNSTDSVYLTYEQDSDGGYNIQAIASSLEIVAFLGKTWNMTFNRDGLMKEIDTNDAVIMMEYVDGKVLEVNGSDGKCLEYKYDNQGKISEVLTYEEGRICEEAIYSYDKNAQLVEINYKNDGQISTTFYVRYNEEGQVFSIEEPLEEGGSRIQKYTYLPNGNIDILTIKTETGMSEYKFLYDRNGRCSSIEEVVGGTEVSDGGISENTDSVKNQITVTKEYAHPYEITGGAYPTVYAIVDWNGDIGARSEILHLYIILREDETGDINIVELPCETAICNADQNSVQKLWQIDNPNELLVTVNANYDLNNSEFIYISMDDLLKAQMDANGGVLDLELSLTEDELATINEYVSAYGKEEMSQAWQKVLDNEPLEKYDIEYVCCIFEKMGITYGTNEKLGRALFYLSEDLAKVTDLFDISYTSYEKEDFNSYWSRNYNVACYNTLFAMPETVGNIGFCYYPDDAEEFAKQVHWLWAGDADYTPNDTVQTIAETMNSIYLEKAGN